MNGSGKHSSNDDAVTITSIKCSMHRLLVFALSLKVLFNNLLTAFSIVDKSVNSHILFSCCQFHYLFQVSGIINGIVSLALSNVESSNPVMQAVSSEAKVSPE